MTVGETLKEDVRAYKCQRMTISFANNLVDYNSWQESDTGLRLAASLNKDVILAEGMS